MIGSIQQTFRGVVLFASIIALVTLQPQMVPAQDKEHPEHPEDEATSEMTVEMLAEAIAGYVARDSKLKGGYFLVFDTVDKNPLQLQLQKVHRDKLAALGDGVYFACTDMKAVDGTIYDLDFLMKQTKHGIETTNVMIHKKSGEPRYTWKEVDGIWEKVGS